MLPSLSIYTRLNEGLQVTMFGESAGAMMTGVQYLNPKLGKLARGAVRSPSAALIPLRLLTLWP